MICKFLSPPALEINAFPADAGVFGGKYNRVAPYNLVKITADKPLLGQLGGHLATVSALHSCHKRLCQAEISSTMRSVSLGILGRDHMCLDLLVCECVDVNLLRVVADFAM